MTTTITPATTTTAVPAAEPTATPAAGRVARLAAEAADAAQVRALTTDPDVIALRVEKVRTQVDALLWAGIVLGLAFTMVNVQSFAAAGAGPDEAGWWVAWLLDPMVSLVLLAVLRAEQVTARYQVALPPWARRTKWLTFAATYVMNTWTSWGLDGAPLSWSGVVLHSVPPLIVFATAETGPGLRDRLTEAVHRALIEHATTGHAPAAALAARRGAAEVDPPTVELPAPPAIDRDDTDTAALADDAAGAYRQGTLDEHGLSLAWADAPPATSPSPSPAAAPAPESVDDKRVAALIAAGVGRRRLSRELDITEYEARQLLQRARSHTPSRTAAARTSSAERPAVHVLTRSGGPS